MISFILKILEPILGFIFKSIDNRAKAKKKYEEMVSEFQDSVNSDSLDEEKRALKELSTMDIP